jgi:uncharacterized protein YbcV (DUF1398 family)
MDAHVKDVVHEATRGSEDGRMAFPAVLRALGEAGVGRYHADLATGARTYFMPDGDFEITQGAPVRGAAPAFDPDGVKAALKKVQAGAIGYPEFCRWIADAGCVGYLVSLSGRNALYYGRSNDSYIEWFPGSNP